MVLVETTKLLKVFTNSNATPQGIFSMIIYFFYQGGVDVDNLLTVVPYEVFV